jgi:hypothetical protein
MAKPVDTITDDLDIDVHTREGVSTPVIEMEGDVQIDISTRDLTFEIKGIAAIVLASHPTDPKGRWLTIGEDVVRKIPKDGAEFILLNRSGDVPVVEWEGMIRRRGW